jgi:hypothetical protein
VSSDLVRMRTTLLDIRMLINLISLNINKIIEHVMDVREAGIKSLRATLPAFYWGF